MATVIVLLLIIVIVVAVIWVLLRQGGSKQIRHHGTHRKPGSIPAARPGGLDKLRDNPMFWGVEMGQPGCEAAQALLGKQFTFDKAPQLPLEGCSSANCTCQFKGLKDRRTWVRRQQDDRRQAIRFNKDHADRRSRKDRRRGNVWIDHDY